MLHLRNNIRQSLRKTCRWLIKIRERLTPETPFTGRFRQALWTGGAPTRYTPLPATTFADLEKYCLFIGYPYSGHSIIGAILNAHPEAVISNELRDFRYLWAGAGREELFTAILKRDRQWTEDGSIGGGDYPYAIPEQWQGRYSRLRVIGDKGGGKLSAVMARKDPQLLEKMRSWIGLPLRLVHITRNPYDTISTMYARLDDPSGDLERDLDGCIRQYFELAGAIHEAVKTLPEDEWLILRHEDFIAHPRDCIGQLCRFLGLEHDEGYLEDCASIVYAGSHKSRLEINWPQQAIAEVAACIRQYPLELGRYNFVG